VSSTDQEIEAKIQHVDHGFWDRVSDVAFPAEVESKMPRTCDRFYEALHFIRLIRDLPPLDDSVPRANWYMGAHLVATIAIRDAGEADFKSAKSGSFKFMPLAREFFLGSEIPDCTGDRDPVAINRNYRLLRNLRVHSAVNVIALEERILEYELYAGTPARKRWFFHRITPEEHTMITQEDRNHNRDSELVTPSELELFNNYSEKRTVIAVAAQHLLTLSRVIEETAARWR
jgi:hypothetical protein